MKIIFFSKQCSQLVFSFLFCKVFFNHYNFRTIYTPLISRVRGAQLAVQIEQTRLRRCLLYGFVDDSGTGTKSFDVLTGELSRARCPYGRLL